MATYELPDDALTAEQRRDYYYGLVPDDAVEITAYLLEHFPAVYDDAVLRTARVNRLAAIKATQGDAA